MRWRIPGIYTHKHVAKKCNTQTWVAVPRAIVTGDFYRAEQVMFKARRGPEENHVQPDGLRDTVRTVQAFLRYVKRVALLSCSWVRNFYFLICPAYIRLSSVPRAGGHHCSVNCRCQVGQVVLAFPLGLMWCRYCRIIRIARISLNSCCPDVFIFSRGFRIGFYLSIL